jgi:hypothetical protein
MGTEISDTVCEEISNPFSVQAPWRGSTTEARLPYGRNTTKYPNPNAEALNAEIPGMPIAEWIHVHRPYVTARIHDQIFQLLDEEEAYVDPYYVYLARSNRNVPALVFEFIPRAVHAAGLMNEWGKEMIVDAARQLTAPKTRVL